MDYQTIALLAIAYAPTINNLSDIIKSAIQQRRDASKRG
ncbi:hypothetical protein PANA5342_1886 [Pantoea ananatis LMG 5342]|nr:hypothetical protein PANA5342_1886 [Pantoea ananatis LMG 5342]